MKALQNKWLFLSLLALIWGSSFILIKHGLIGLNAYQVGSLRMIFAAIFLLTVGFRYLRHVRQEQWKYLALTAFFGTFAPAFLFALAETQIDSSITSILNSLVPINTLILGIMFFGLEYRRSQVLGVIVGLIGSILLVFNGALQHPEQNYYYALFVIVAVICYAINVNLVRTLLPDLHPISVATGNSLVTLLPSLIILACTGFFSQVHQTTVQHSVIFIMLLGIFSTGIANILFFRLIQWSSPVFATSVTYLIPIVACIWGLLDHEYLGPVQLLGAGIILAGIYLSTRK